ncbi:MAG: hypothetical protein ABFR36_00985 [Acidobacteriota bacterium]
MEINDELKKISDDYNELIEDLIPRSIPPASMLMEKRESGDKLYLKAGRLGMAYAFLIVLFAFISMFLIDSIKSEELSGGDQILNAAIFSSADHGSFVSAFREVTK